MPSLFVLLTFERNITLLITIDALTFTNSLIQLNLN